MKKCSLSLAIKELLIKTTLGFNLIPVLVKMWGKRNPCTVLGGMQASATTLEKNMEAS
jgi:hypothetical protein